MNHVWLALYETHDGNTILGIFHEKAAAMDACVADAAPDPVAWAEEGDGDVMADIDSYTGYRVSRRTVR